MNAFQMLTALTADKFKTVSVVFNSTKYAVGHEREYTYKVGKDVEVAEGDFAIVVSPSDGLTVVKIVEVHETAQIDPDATFIYKWLVTTFSVVDYEALIESESKLLKDIKADMQTKRNETSLDEAKALLTDSGKKILSSL